MENNQEYNAGGGGGPTPPTQDVALASVIHRVRHEVNAEMVREGLENWQSLGIVNLSRLAEGVIHLIRCDPPPQLTEPPDPPVIGQRTLALLSLFDGVGTARLAVDL